ncbi:MAG: hypothetical protein RMA76_37805 [Deltaproteobacteria bacterium]
MVSTLRPEDLRVGEVYFEVLYCGPELSAPIVETFVYVGKEDGGYIFQDAGAFFAEQRGERVDAEGSFRLHREESLEIVYTQLGLIAELAQWRQPAPPPPPAEALRFDRELEKRHATVDLLRQAMGEEHAEAARIIAAAHAAQSPEAATQILNAALERERAPFLRELYRSALRRIGT